MGENDPGDPTQPNELNAVNWSEYTSGGWTNREMNNDNGPYGDPTNYHMALGNAGGYGAFIWQDVSVADDGAMYELSADISLDAWWMNSAYLKIEFYDAGGTDPENMVGFVEMDHISQPGYDQGLPWANYGITGTAPAGTVTVRAVLGTYGEGGTARFDNAVLEVVPEPATLALLGLGGLLLRRRK